MNLLSKQATYYKCRESAASEHVAYVPGEILCWPGGPVPETLRTYEAVGVIERLEGKPGIGVDFRTLTPSMFAPPRPEPVEEPFLELEAFRSLAFDP